MKASYIIPCELCVVEARRKNYLNDPDSRCINFYDWKPPYYVSEEVVGIVKWIFVLIAESGLVVPYIDCYRDGTIKMTWYNESNTQPYYLYVQVRPGKAVRFEVTRYKILKNDHTWKHIESSDKLTDTLNHAAHYVLGKKP